MLQLARNQLSREALLEVKEKSLVMLENCEDLEQLFHGLAEVMGVVKEALNAPPGSPLRNINR